MFGQRIEAARSRLRSSVAAAKKIEDMVSNTRKVRNVRAGLRLDNFLVAATVKVHGVVGVGDALV